MKSGEFGMLTVFNVLGVLLVVFLALAISFSGKSTGTKSADESPKADEKMTKPLTAKR
jgi:hypothetical protein